MTPAGFPLPAHDVAGLPLDRGTLVRIVSVHSFISRLSQEEARRLQSLVGQLRNIVAFDKFGFAWLSFDPHQPQSDFCVFPQELALP
ncbi:hypothetical protein [Silvimonas amylolytica]|uniref:Uncharacterized protein n=1 Tax=Silvimonas amylolytica TaxID=449663 RepID=A0ABQ2PLX8_9NEIS|nr:hypothetical protein [Silvimonas amylolytica]GGP26607.1 hypothetical protein GCM10010971_24260 [Silvimonas amylolytica]